MNAIGGGWMGGNGGWGWTSATAATVYYPTAITVTDVTNEPLSKPRRRTPVEWLEDQIAEITGLAVA